MLKRYVSFSLFFLLFLAIGLEAGHREYKVRLTGEIKEEKSLYLSASEIESGLKVIHKKIYNPYDQKIHTYGGVLLDDFIQKYAKEGIEALKLIAIDDYIATVEKKDWKTIKILLVTQVDKKYIGVKDKGPLMTVFLDYSSTEKVFQENIDLWVWMIKQIEFK